jgi:hypothetical protein
MKKIIIIIIFLTGICCLLNTSSVLAQSKILINEFLIDPQPQSVEIFNSGTESADLSGWIIDDSGGTTFYTIPQNNLILPNQCLVFSGDFNLNKTSADTIKLINNYQELIDSFSYKSSSGSGISYYRFPDNSDGWTTGSATLGFYNQTNISCLITPTPMPISTPSPTSIQIQPTPTLPAVVPTEAGPSPVSYDNIYISETMVNPVSGEKEWLEIYNNNDFPVFLNNWYLDDLENSGSSPKIFSLEINSKSYGVFNLTTSIFNNNGDSVRLLDFNRILKDDFEYNSSIQGKTFGRILIDNDNFCLQEPSPNFSNNPCINPTSTITTSVKTGRINPSPTILTPTNKPVLINQLARRNLDGGGLIETKNSGQVLGVSNETVTNFPNNKSLVNLLTILSLSYSLLTIISILFKMKLRYGKIKRLYSLSLHSPRRK